MSALLRLYPPAWRTRYGDEMASLLEERSPTARERADLARGALDAWLHPSERSLVPIAAAFVGSGLWTVMASAVVFQPAPLDWPGYLIDTVPLAILAAACLFVAAVGCALRASEARSRAAALGNWLLIVGYLAWIAMLAGTAVGAVSEWLLGASQSIAMLGTLAIGLLLVREHDQPIGWLLLVAPVAVLVPSTVLWLGFGMAWTAVGVAMWLDRDRRTGTPTVRA